MPGLSAGTRRPVAPGPNDVFGDVSLITGPRHSVAAVASVDAWIWELRKTDFSELLAMLPELTDKGAPLAIWTGIGAALDSIFIY